MGFNRANLFNSTHDHMYNYTVGKADNLIATIWDNAYELNIQRGLGAQTTPNTSTIDFTWFETRNFDYVFVSPAELMTQLMAMPVWTNAVADVDQIWNTEEYDQYVSEWYADHDPNVMFIKHVMTRHTLMYSTRLGEKFLNRSYQALAPDGTWGFIWKHFFEKYCGCVCDIVPVLRETSGLPIDPMRNRPQWPQGALDFAANILEPHFAQYRIDTDMENLTTNINAAFVSSEFEMHYLNHHNTALTLNKDIFDLEFAYRIRENHMDGFRLWEYGPGV